MSELSKLLGTAGEPHTIIHGEKAYRFRLIDQIAKDAVEKRLYQQAREAVYVDRGQLTSDEYMASLDRVRARYERGEFDFLGDHARGILKTPRGTLLLLSVLTGEDQDSLLKLLAARAEEVKTVLTTVMTESFPSSGAAQSNG